MILRILTFLLFSIITTTSHGQQSPVVVADLTLKIGGMEYKDLYYGFAQGDQILFSFEELKGKELKEIEIIELPSSGKFMDYKSSKIENKKIQVFKKGVYRFRFTNTALGGRICKIKIQRVPKSKELVAFNTDWKWKTLYDTTYIPYTTDSLVGYDTVKYQEKVKELVKTEQIDDLIMDKTQRVHSFFNENSSRTYLRVDLPQDKIQTYKEEKIIAWAYWIGVGEESSKAYAQNVEAMRQMATGLAQTFGTPLAGLAVGAVTQLITPKIGDDVEYDFITDFQNAQAYLVGQKYYRFDHGKGVAAYGKNTSRLNGTFYIGLYNDNNTQGIDVNVKIVVIKEVKTYEDKIYKREKITPRYVTLNRQRMVVTAKKIRVNVD